MKPMTAESMALLGHRCGLTLLIELQLEEPVYLTAAAINIVYEGVTWIGGRGINVERVSDQAGEVQAMRFSLSGVPSEVLALALATPIQGKLVRAHTVLLHPDTGDILDVISLWVGTLDQMPINQDAGSSVVSVTAEHIAIAMSRPKGARYTDADQRRLYPGDRCLEYLVAQSTHQDVWPSAAYFRK